MDPRANGPVDLAAERSRCLVLGCDPDGAWHRAECDHSTVEPEPVERVDVRDPDVAMWVRETI